MSSTREKLEKLAEKEWNAYDPNDKVNAVWLSQYKTKEDREKLFEEIP